MADMTALAKTIVQLAMEEADRRVPGNHEKGRALATLLEREVGHPIKYKTVQSYARETGIKDVPAWVLLAAAKVTGISIDEYLHRETIQAKLERFERELQELRERLPAEQESRG